MMASDGLFDVMEDQSVIDTVGNHLKEHQRYNLLSPALSFPIHTHTVLYLSSCCIKRTVYRFQLIFDGIFWRVSLTHLALSLPPPAPSPPRSLARSLSRSRSLSLALALARVLARSYQGAADKLTELAIEKGSLDNVTVVIIEFLWGADATDD